jgi:hypothetical protein
VHSRVKCGTCCGGVVLWIFTLCFIFELSSCYLVYLLQFDIQEEVVNYVVLKHDLFTLSNCCLIFLLAEMCHLTLALFGAGT